MYHSVGTKPDLTLRRLSIATVVLIGTVVFAQRTRSSGTHLLPLRAVPRLLQGRSEHTRAVGDSRCRTASWYGSAASAGAMWKPVLQPCPKHPILIGGLSQTFGATLLLRKCVDQWGAQLDDPVSLRSPSFPEPQTTLRQLLSHVAPSGEYRVLTDEIRVADSGHRAMRSDVVSRGACVGDS